MTDREVAFIYATRERRAQAYADGLNKQPMSWAPTITPDTTPDELTGIIEARIMEALDGAEDPYHVGRDLLEEICQVFIGEYIAGLRAHV